MDQLPSQPGWERELVTKLAQMNVKEQRAKRRWSIFFRLIWITLAVLVFAWFNGWVGHGMSGSDSVGRHTALVKMDGEISDHSKASAENINAALEAAFKDPDSVAVVLNINSPGGSVTSTLAMLDTMNHVKPHVATVCVGIAASGAAVLLAGGQKGKRFVLPNAEVMIHQPWGGAQGQATDIEITARHILATRDRLNKILAKASGQLLSKIEKDVERDFFMTAEEAKKYGLVDEIYK